MKAISNVVIVVGAASMGIGVVLRLVAKEVGLGLVPSSFLELSVACFLLAIALNSASTK